jgi:acyl-homoserine-lactone acylase
MVVVLGCLLASLLPQAAVPAAGAGGLRATIRRTSDGIPHILAADFAGVGYGYGYAFASDNICVMAESYVTVDAQRSRYFGAGGSWTFEGNGFTANNLNSDFFFQQIIDDGRIERMLKLAPPNGPRQEVLDSVRGYVAGYNRYLAEVGVGGITDPACRGKPWVHSITEIEAYRRFYQLALLGSSAVAIDGIGAAAPTSAACNPAALAPATVVDGLRQLHPPIGSNAVALGADATQNGHGMLLGNPHFPWHGSERFYQFQATIPGVLNVSGAGLFGLPAVNIGHTDAMAWSHTVSTAWRFTPYQLALVPGLPTSYLVDGVPEAMTSRTMTVLALRPDGSLQPRSRTLYRSRWGPMITSLAGLPLPWCATTAFSMADVNEANFRLLDHFLETDMAHSTQQEYQVLLRNQGVPWVNTLVADDSGQALYADISVVPNVPDSMVTICATPAGQALFQAMGLPILDGSMSSCAWRTDADAVVPGIFGPSHLPHLFRADYTENSNDSYWLSNPHQPLEGFNRIIGDERTARGLRTRLGLTMIEEFLNGLHGRPISKFTRQQMQDMVFNDRQYGGELARDSAVAMCNAFPLGLAPTTTGTVAVGTACAALAAWDLHENIDSAGAVLWREFWSSAINAPGVWSTTFDANDPIDTPNSLATNNVLVQRAFGNAVKRLKDDGISFDAPLRTLQYAQRGATRIPLHGGPSDPNGTFNALDVGALTGKANGYGDVSAISSGSSFVQAVSFNGTGCPDARTILTYSESSNPNSPYYADQTLMFSNKQWVIDRFCERDILADPNLLVTTISDDGGPSPAAALPNTTALGPAGDPGIPGQVAIALATFALIAVIAMGRKTSAR